MRRFIRKNTKLVRAATRHARVRSRVAGTALKPRLSVWRGSRSLSAQLIDDTAGRTLAFVHSREVAKAQAKADLSGKVAVAYAAGQALGARALAIGLKQCVFDRGSYRYHGRVKAVADGARAAGLEF